MSDIQLPPEIDTTALTPRSAIGFDAASYNRSFPPNTRRVLLVGQRLAAGAVAAATPVDVLRSTQGETDFGAGSVLDLAIKAAFKANPRVRLAALAVSDANGATAASAYLTLAAGAATEAGAIETVIAGHHTIRTAIAEGDDEEDIVAAHVDDINAVADVPVIASIHNGNAKRLDLVAKNAGTVGNDIAISSSFTRSITTTVTASAAKLGSGATDPSLATALAAVAGERYHLIVVLLDKSSPFGEADDHVALESDGEHGRGEVALIATTGTLGAATTIAAARNSARAVQWWCKGTTSSFVRLAAAAAAVMASETNAAMPYNTLVLPGILPPTIANRPTPTEIENALAGGVAPIVVNASGKLAMVRAVTTRTLNDSGLPDGTLRDVNVVQIFDRIRDALASMFSTRYGRRIWADDDPEGLLPPYVATPAKVKEDALVVLRKLQSDEGIVQRVDELADDFVVQKVGDQCQFSLPTDMTRGLQAVLGKVALFLV